MNITDVLNSHVSGLAELLRSRHGKALELRVQRPIEKQGDLCWRLAQPGKGDVISIVVRWESQRLQRAIEFGLHRLKRPPTLEELQEAHVAFVGCLEVAALEPNGRAREIDVMFKFGSGGIRMESADIADIAKEC